MTLVLKLDVNVDSKAWVSDIYTLETLLSLGMTIISHSCFSFLSRIYFKISALWFCFSRFPNHEWQVMKREYGFQTEQKLQKEELGGPKGKSCRFFWPIFICLFIDIILLYQIWLTLNSQPLRMHYSSWIIEVVFTSTILSGQKQNPSQNTSTFLWILKCETGDWVLEQWLYELYF